MGDKKICLLCSTAETLKCNPTFNAGFPCNPGRYPMDPESLIGDLKSGWKNEMTLLTDDTPLPGAENPSYFNKPGP